MRYINILADLCKRADFDGRINTDLTYDAFTRGSEQCLREAIASGQNVLLCPPAGQDSTLIKNYVRVYGSEKESCLIMHTKKATSPKPWRKDIIINDTSIQNRAQAVDRATKEYDNLSDAEVVASPICLGLPYLTAGQSIQTFIEYVLNGNYVASKISHYLQPGSVETRVTLNELERDGLKVIKDNERDIREKFTFQNPNDMEYSYHFTFDDEDDIDSLDDCELSDGKLIVSTGKSSAVMTSKALTLDADQNYVEVRFKGNEASSDTTFEVSCDDGENYDTTTPGADGEPGTQFAITNNGKKIRLKINLNGATEEIEAASVLTKA